jgi:hypothetical protein
MYTETTILLSTSSGSGLMEGAVRSCTNKKAAVFSVGAFGDRWFKMATSNGIPADRFKSEPGKHTSAEMVEKALATGEYDLVTVTHNETSSGIQNPVEEIAEVMKKYPEVIFCVDAAKSVLVSLRELPSATSRKKRSKLRRKWNSEDSTSICFHFMNTSSKMTTNTLPLQRSLICSHWITSST